MRTIVVADLHLSRWSLPTVATDLARLLAGNPGACVVLAGDLLDLAVDDPARSRAAAVRSAVSGCRELRTALRAHLEGGGEAYLLAGNHDSDLATPSVRDALVQALALTEALAARLHVSPWFVRLGQVHIEHGHLYDPDNAPAHPLVVGEKALGAHFCTEFLIPTGAHSYLHDNDDTPARLFVRAFVRHGWRGPYVVGRYFVAAFEALARSGPLYRGRGETEQGMALEAGFAEAAGVPLATVAALRAHRATPTMRSTARTFARTYLDRSLPTAAMVVGLATLAVRRRRVGAALLGIGAVSLAASWVGGRDRYRGTTIELLRAAAARVKAVTGARLVVFGHSHHPELSDGYANPGSFAYPESPAEAGRPYLVLDPLAAEPRPELCWLPPAAS